MIKKENKGKYSLMKYMQCDSINSVRTFGVMFDINIIFEGQ